MEIDAILFVDYAVIELGELCLVPTVCSTHEITGNALQLVKIPATALGTLLKVLC
jgi:hypothetical protein